MKDLILFRNTKTDRYSIFSPRKNISSAIQYNAAHTLITIGNLQPIRFSTPKEFKDLKAEQVEIYNLQRA